MLQGHASKTFNDEDFKECGGFGNYSGNKYVSSNQRMDEIGEDAFVAQMEIQVKELISFATNAPRIIQMKELIIKK